MNTNNYIENSLPGSARTWIYQSSRNFTPQEVEQLKKDVGAFTEQWAAHKLQLAAWGDVILNRFVVLMVDESATGASGCSIDSSVRFIREQGNSLKVDFFNRFEVAWIDASGEVLSCNANVLYTKVADGIVNEETLFFNNLPTSKSDAMNSWVLPLKKHWALSYASKPNTESFTLTL
jgi:hypothetical protein